MQTFVSEVHYQDDHGKSRSKRYNIKALNCFVAIDKTHFRVTRLKGFRKIIGGGLQALNPTPS
jgi:hypothetical protein